MADAELAGVHVEPDDLWAEVVGQDAAVAQLRAAVASPVHAYLLLGPEGSGTREAARAFAADLLADGLDPDAAAVVRRQVAAEAHPSLTVVERVGPSISAAQMRDVVVRANMAPPEGERQVVVLVDFHLAASVAPILLKTLEEPPPSTVFVVLAEELRAELETIASRCVRVGFAAVSESVIRDRLVAEGVDPEAAAIAAAGAGGSMTQARLLGQDPNASARRDRWYSIPERLDGTGATAAALVDEVLAATEELAVPLTERQAEERAEFEERAGLVGGRVATERKALLDRHKREQRRVRTADLRSGLAALVARYRDALIDGGDPDQFVAAADAVQELADALVFYPNETLQLQALFVGLPPLRPAIDLR
jgi:DNA polymerase-3 subunit delta'